METTIRSVENERPSLLDRALLPLLMVLAALLRIIGLRWAHVAHGDAVSRIFLVWQDLQNPSAFLSSTWGMLHFLFMAAALRIWFDPIHSPVLMHIIFSVATAVPLYFWVRREWGKTPSLYVTAASLFYPVAIRQSYLPLTEVPFVFFAVCAANFVSAARQKQSAANSLLAGLFQTFACAIRMEGWLLIPMFAVLLRSNRKLMAVFLIVACLYPCHSMLQNYFASGDPLPWVSIAKDWQIKVSGVNENLSAATVVARLLYFPSVLLFGMTPLLFFACIAGAVLIVRERRSEREWLLPVIGLICIFMIQAARGLLLLEIRYSLILGYLLLPFAGEIVRRFEHSPNLKVFAFLVLISLVPFSYARVVYARVVGPAVSNPIPADLEVIPKVSHRAVRVSHQVVNRLRNTNEGLILDFFNWKDTRYVALMSKLYPSQIWFMPGARYEKLEVENFAEFLKLHSKGIFIVVDHSRLIQIEDSNIVINERATKNIPRIQVDFVAREADLSVYRYQTVP